MKRSTLIDIIKFIAVLAAAAWLFDRGAGTLGYNWQWYQIPRYIFSFENGRFISGPLLDGLIVTLQISGISLIFSFFLGLVTALLRLSNSFAAKGLARLYLEIIRNTPLIVQLFFIYFVLSPLLDISRFTSAVLALSLFEGAYASEIFRSGIVSVHKGQWEAAGGLGLNRFQAYRYIILPQAVQRILPPLSSQAISLVKDSALVSTIAIYDLTMQGRVIISQTYLVFEIWFTVAAIYLVILVSMSFAVNILEHHLKLKV